MDADNLALASGLVSRSYISQGGQALAKRHKLIKSLLSSRRLPQEGWDEDTIEVFIKVWASPLPMPKALTLKSYISLHAQVQLHQHA